MSNSQLLEALDTPAGLERQVEALREQISSLGDPTAAKPKLWEGPGGDWLVLGFGDVRHINYCGSMAEHREHGHCGKTKEQAGFIRDQLKNYAWMLHAWLEVVGDWRPDWEDIRQQKWFAQHCDNHTIGIDHTVRRRQPHLFYFETGNQVVQWLEMVQDKIKAQTGEQP